MAGPNETHRGRKGLKTRGKAHLSMAPELDRQQQCSWVTRDEETDHMSRGENARDDAGSPWPSMVEGRVETPRTMRGRVPNC